MIGNRFLGPAAANSNSLSACPRQRPPNRLELKLFQEFLFTDSRLAQHPLGYHVVEFNAIMPNQGNRIWILGMAQSHVRASLMLDREAELEQHPKDTTRLKGRYLFTHAAFRLTRIFSARGCLEISPGNGTFSLTIPSRAQRMASRAMRRASPSVRPAVIISGMAGTIA